MHRHAPQPHVSIAYGDTHVTDEDDADANWRQRVSCAADCSSSGHGRFEKGRTQVKRDDGKLRGGRRQWGAMVATEELRKGGVTMGERLHNQHVALTRPATLAVLALPTVERQPEACARSLPHTAVKAAHLRHQCE